MKKPKNLRAALIQSRVTSAELQEILTKAHVYTEGSVSRFVRLACLNYRPIERRATK